MTQKRTAKVLGKMPLLLGVAVLALGVPSAGLALVGFADIDPNAQTSARALFTPATADPSLARRVAEQVRDRGFRFTPTNTKPVGDRTVTVAVRIDGSTAQAISVRSAIDAAPGGREGFTAIEPTRYNLGIARGYKSFARPIAQSENRVGVGTRTLTLPDTIRKLDVPDLSSFEPGKGSAADKPSRFQPRISLEDKEAMGSSKGTIEGSGKQMVDVGGSYRVTRNLDVTAGVRISQENDRLAPLTDSIQDNQAVYVGTQFRF